MLALVLLAPLVLAQTPPAPGNASGADLAAEPPSAEVQQLEQALDGAETDRQIAQAQRDQVIEQLQAMTDQLAAVQDQLALAEDCRVAQQEEQAAVARGVDGADAQLRDLLSQLAYGSTDQADDVLASAAQAAAAADSRPARALLAAAQDAVSQSDLFTARRYVAAALGAMSGGVPASSPGGY